MTALMVLLLMAALLSVGHLRQEAESRVAASTQNLLQSIELNIEGLIGTIDVGLMTSVDEIERQFATGKPDTPAISRFLLRQKEHLAHVVKLRATNENGDVIYGPDTSAPRSATRTGIISSACATTPRRHC